MVEKLLEGMPGDNSKKQELQETLIWAEMRLYFLPRKTEEQGDGSESNAPTPYTRSNVGAQLPSHPRTEDHGLFPHVPGASEPDELYTNLNRNKKEIRVFRLQPGELHDPIECTLSVVSPNDKPAFEALSYVWGNPQDTFPIHVNNTVFGATLGLVTALQRLRTLYEAHSL